MIKLMIFLTCAIIAIIAIWIIIVVLSNNSKYDDYVNYIKSTKNKYQEITFNAFKAVYPYLEQYIRINTFVSGEYIKVILPSKKCKKDVSALPYALRLQVEESIFGCHYILLFPNYKELKNAVNFVKEEREKASRISINKAFAERASVDVLKFCQKEIQADLEKAEVEITKACKDIKYYAGEINKYDF